MEPKVQLIFSNSVEQGIITENESNLSVINPFIAVNPKYFPTQYSFALSILTFGINMTGNETMSIKISSPTGKEVLYTGELDTPVMKENANVIMNLELKNLNLDEQGEFKVEFKFDNTLIESTPFFVQHIPEE